MAIVGALWSASMRSPALAPLPRSDLDEFIDVLGVWRADDVDDLGLEPDDLQLLVRLRVRDDQEAPDG
jgi:hypothetical protein